MLQHPLSELKPIALPAEPGIWPLAIGWWILLMLIVALIILALVIMVKRRHFWAVQRRSLSLAKTLTDHRQLNRILKRVALHYYPVHRVAGLSGKSWANFLNLGLAPEHHRQCEQICAALYKKPLASEEQCYQKIAIAWLSGLSRKKIEAVHNA